MKPAQFHTEKIRTIARLAELSQDITWITDLLSGRILYVNREVMAMHGLVPEAWLKENAGERRQLIHPDDRAFIDDYYSSLAGVADDSEVKTVEFRAMTASGNWLSLAAKGRVFDREADGAVRWVLSTACTIPQQKKTGQEIIEHRGLLEKIMDAPNVGMSVFKAVRDEAGAIQDFRFEFVNRRTLEAFQGNDPCGRLLTDYGTDGLEQLQFFKDVINTGKVNSYTRKAESGIVEGWFLFSNAPLGDDRLVQVWEDITEIKKAEQAVKESRELLRATINSSPDRVHVMKAVRNGHGAIVDFRWLLMNDAAIQKFGNLSGELWLKHYPGVVEEEIFDAFKQVVETGVSIQHEKHYRHEGHDMWIYQSIVKLDDGVVNTTRDISERKKADEEIIRLKDEIAQKATDKYRTLFETIDEGFAIMKLVRDEQGQIVDLVYQEVNKAFERHTGLGNITGKTSRETIPNYDPARFKFYQQIVDTGETSLTEFYVGDINRWLRAYHSRLGAQGSDQIVAVFEDITERKLQEERQAFLLKLSDTISMLGDPKKICMEACRFLGEYLNADRALFCTFEEQGRIANIAGFHAPGVPEFPKRAIVKEHSQKIHDEQMNGPVLVTDTQTDERITDEQRKNNKELKVGAYMVVPLIKAGELIANIAIHQATSRQWTEMDLTLTKEVAERTWAAIERALAEKALYKSRQMLSKELDDTKRLQQISNRIIEENDIQSLYEAILDSAMEVMDSDFASIQILDPETNQLYLLVHKGFHPGSAKHWQYVEAGPTSVCGHALATGKRVIVYDIDQPSFDMNKDDIHPFRLSGIRSVQSTPLISRAGNHVGMMSTHWREPRHLTEREFNLFDVLARQTADLIERKRAEEALHRSEEKFRVLFNSMDEGYCIIQMLYNGEGKVCDWRYLEVNPAFERHNGLEHAAGKTIRELVPDIENKWMEIYAQVAETGRSVRFEESSAALQRVFDLYAFRIGKPEDRKVAVLFADITKRKKSEQALYEREAWINGQKEAFQAAINGEPLAVSLDALVRMVAQQFNGEANAAFYMAPPGGAGLQFVAGMREIRAQDADGFSTGAGSLACSLAMQTGEPVIISDIATDPLWETWRHMASESGYRGCWSFPVRVKKGAVVGTFAIYFKHPRQPTPAELGLTGVVTHAASIIISSDTQLMERSQAEEALKELNLGLEQRVEKRSQEIIALKMRQEQEKLNAVIFAQEQERTRIGEGLHNGVAQLLYAVQSRLQLVCSNGDDDDKNLKASMQIISEAIHDTRRLSFELMPPVLKDFGLATALNTLMGRIFHGKTRLKMNVGLKKRLSENLEISIYRIVQEAINNILKHADATEAMIDISESRDAIKIKIADNGIGFLPGEVRKYQKGVGLQTIGNRVKLLSGSLKFKSAPGKGTSLDIRLPLRP